jgi:hypothetical protein
VSTAAELDALNVGSMVVSAWDGGEWHKTLRGDWLSGGGSLWSSAGMVRDEAEYVLFRPDAPQPATGDDAMERATHTGADAVQIRVRHTGGNTVAGPIGLVLDTHLAKGWVLDEVSIPDAALAAARASEMADAAVDAVERAVEAFQSVLIAHDWDWTTSVTRTAMAAALAAARAGESERDPVFGLTDAESDVLAEPAQRGGEAVDRDGLIAALNAADVDFSAREGSADAGHGREPGDWFAWIADAALTFLTARGGTAPTEVEWGVRVSNGSIQDGFGSRDEAASWAHDIEDGTLMQRDVTAWREVQP